MKTNIVKILLLYWTVMAGVDMVVDLVYPLQMRRSPPMRKAIHSAMAMLGERLSEAYETHGCDATKSYSMTAGDSLYLADTNGRILCGDPDTSGLEPLAAYVRGTSRVLAHSYDKFQVVGTSMKSRSGRQYVLFLKNDVAKPNFFTWMFPGPTTVAVSCTIALVFAILLSLPVRRLRQATREMASGRLDVRVPNRHRLTLFGKQILDDDLDRLTIDFNRMAERIQGLVEAQNLLLRDVSHELRSPLARLNVTLALSRREAGNQMQIHLNRIEREANKLGDLIARLLSLSYMETMREIRDATAVSLSDLVRNVLPNVQYEASLRRCFIETRLGRDCAIRGDANLLESALENILRNALRYTPEDGIIEVVLTQLENGQRRLAELRVCDRGPGVPEDELEAILRPFYQVDRARQNKAGGYGLGLAIASRVVRLHGGNIVAANRNDGGLAVRMLFPVA